MTREKQIILITMVKYYVVLFAGQSIIKKKAVLIMCKAGTTKQHLSPTNEKMFKIFFEKHLIWQMAVAQKQNVENNG